MLVSLTWQELLWMALHQVANLGLIGLTLTTPARIALYALATLFNFGLHVWYCVTYRDDPRYAETGMTREDWRIFSSTLWLVVLWPVYTVLAIISLVFLWPVRQR